MTPSRWALLCCHIRRLGDLTGGKAAANMNTHSRQVTRVAVAGVKGKGWRWPSFLPGVRLSLGKHSQPSWRLWECSHVHTRDGELRAEEVRNGPGSEVAERRGDPQWSVNIRNIQTCEEAEFIRATLSTVAGLR